MGLKSLYIVALAFAASGTTVANATVNINDLVVVEEAGITKGELAKKFNKTLDGMDQPDWMTSGNQPSWYTAANQPDWLTAGNQPDWLTAGNQPNWYSSGKVSLDSGKPADEGFPSPTMGSVN